MTSTRLTAGKMGAEVFINSWGAAGGGQVVAVPGVSIATPDFTSQVQSA